MRTTGVPIFSLGACSLEPDARLIWVRFRLGSLKTGGQGLGAGDGTGPRRVLMRLR